jgi:antitoxin Phd
MRRWQLQEAKAKFSELLDKVATEGPQVVTRRGIEEAVVVPMAEWRRLKETAPPGLKEWLLGNGPRDIYVPPRGRLRTRKPISFDD